MNESTKKAPAEAATSAEARHGNSRQGISKMDFSTTSTRLQAILPHGAENAVSGRELAGRLHISQRRLRAVVSDARRRGVLVLSGDYGYCLPSFDCKRAVTEMQDFRRRMNEALKTNRASTTAVRKALWGAANRGVLPGQVQMQETTQGDGGEHGAGKKDV